MKAATRSSSLNRVSMPFRLPLISSRCFGIWFALRVLGIAAMTSVDAAGGIGLLMDLDGEGRILVFRAGPAIVAMKGPSDAPIGALIELANGLQF